MTKTRDGWKLESTGRQFYAYSSIIGIDAEELVPTYGNDGDIVIDFSEEEELHPEEKKELAQHMIALWKKYGDI